MKKTGAALARFALEQLGVSHTFGIPGVHNTELYDELNASPSIQPVLVTHECGAAFMADAFSRTGSSIGTLVIVPAAGVTHAASGIGEAGLDGIPMLILSGGIHSESGRQFQLHDIDQHALLAPITKASFRILSHAEVIPTLYEAYRIATTGEPGPVFVELPYNIGNFLGEVEEMPAFVAEPSSPPLDPALLRQAARLLVDARKPGLFLGWGAMGAQAELIQLAELLAAPVCTTLQGLSAFPATHPLHVGMGFGDYAVPAAANAFADCDCLLAVGTRFAEIPTGSYSMPVPAKLIHLDINPQVFGANYPARVALAGAAEQLIPALLAEVRADAQRAAAQRAGATDRRRQGRVRQGVAAARQPRAGESGGVLPGTACAAQRPGDRGRRRWQPHLSAGRADADPRRARFHLAQRLQCDGLLRARHDRCQAGQSAAPGGGRGRRRRAAHDRPGTGHCQQPGARSGAVRVQRRRAVADRPGAGDSLQPQDLHRAAAAQPGRAGRNHRRGVRRHREQRAVCRRHHPGDDAGRRGRPVLVDVRIDYSKRTRFTEGVVKATLKRFTPRDKLRVVSRALWRRVTG